MKFLSTIKNHQSYYYLKNFLRSILPSFIYRRRLNYWISKSNQYPKELILSRLAYYNSIKENTPLAISSEKIGSIKKPKKGSRYYFDLIRYTRYFNPNFKINYKFGDVTENQEIPTIVKSRPIDNNGNSILMRLDALRHFKFIEDSVPYSEKKNKAVWRGVVHKENRKSLVSQFYNHPKCNIGQTGHKNLNPLWIKDFISIKEQLQYKFILSIEGVDVATNLKWIMSSNSLCFMPTPKFETWYMEGKLIPNHHYVHIKDDYSDLIEKIDYYSSHENEALEIIENAQSWAKSFQDPELENLLSILVLEKYFKNTGQK